MVFSSILFLFRFLPITLAIYYLAPRKLKNAVLVVCSLFFYSWGEVRYFPIMLASTVVDYTCSRMIESHREKKNICRFWMGVSLLFNLGSLGFFKYTNFFAENINALFGTDFGGINLVLPLGISFYTFQTLSYTIDVYRGKTKAERNIINFAAFVTLFPQLIAGPIVKYTDISRELRERKVDLAQINDGIMLFIFGLGKKVLIANNVGSLWDQVQALGFANISMPLAWLGIIAYSFQIYFDFSGYSLMAIGMGKMLGFEFPQNFNYPYISKSMTEFWRRWHMTLGGWFREYVYIPLGGNRCSKARNYFNIFVVWAATGFWHGASWNFVLWGLFFFVFLVLEKTFLLKHLEKGKFWPHIYVLFFLALSWALFAITDFSQLGLFITRLFCFEGGTDWIYYLRNYFLSFVIAAFCSVPLVEKLYSKIKRYPVVHILLLGLILLVSVAYLVDATYNPFLYFRF